MNTKRARNAALEGFEEAVSEALREFLRAWPEGAPAKVSRDIVGRVGELLATTTFHAEEE